MNRSGRIFLAAAFFSVALATAGAQPQSARLRIVAGNLTSGNNSSYDRGEGVRIFRGLKPDIALVQETNYRSNRDADLQAFVEQAFGTGFHFWREPNRPKPNAIVSRWPITAKGVWEDSAAPDREFVWARINIPGPVDLWAVSVHLLTNDSKRPAEARELVAFVRKSVPAGDYLVIGGDLNTDTMRDRAFDALDDVIAIPEILPADGKGRTGTNASRQKPYDHVLVNGALQKLRAPVVIGSAVGGGSRTVRRFGSAADAAYGSRAGLPGAGSGDSLRQWSASQSRLVFSRHRAKCTRRISTRPSQRWSLFAA